MKSPEQPLSRNDLKEFPASGMSMGTRWRRVDSIVTIPPDRQLPRWSNIIVYQTPDGLVAHRIVRCIKKDGKRWWITKGDGFLAPDRIPVDDNDVLGVAVAVRTATDLISLDTTSENIRGMFHGLIGRITLLIWPPLWSVAKKNVRKM